MKTKTMLTKKTIGKKRNGKGIGRGAAEEERGVG